MALFGSTSKSSTTATTQSAGFSEVGSAQSLNLSGITATRGSNNFNLLDGGAIAKAFDFAGAANAGALKQVELAGAQSAALVKDSIAAVSESARSETENVTITAVKWGVAALIAWALFGAIRRGSA